MSRYEQKVKDGVARLLEDGEQVLAAVIAGPRDSMQQAARLMQLGSAKSGRVRGAAEQVDLRLEAPMAVALTQWRLLALKIGAPTGLGVGGRVKALLSAVPIAEVDSIVVKRLALGYTITLTVRGVAIKLEANAASGAKSLAHAFDQARPVSP
jgi:hypothetical protein